MAKETLIQILKSLSRRDQLGPNRNKSLYLHPSSRKRKVIAADWAIWKTARLRKQIISKMIACLISWMAYHPLIFKSAVTYFEFWWSRLQRQLGKMFLKSIKKIKSTISCQVSTSTVRYRTSSNCSKLGPSWSKKSISNIFTSNSSQID